jgi:two-component sensor histidine kinase
VTGDLTYRLECCDNGIGARSAQPEQSRTQGIGLSLVSAAAANLGGETQTDLTPDGSHLVLEFSDKPFAEAFVAE